MSPTAVLLKPCCAEPGRISSGPVLTHGGLRQRELRAPVGVVDLAEVVRRLFWCAAHS
ncbi:hypothetical protein [Streptomyces sp. TE33382]